MSLPRLPLLRPRLPDADALLPYLRQIDGNAYYTNFGPLNQSLIERLVAFQAARFGRRVFGVTTSSATLALELLIADLGLPPGSKILVPALTFVATASAVLRCGHVPVAADVDAHHWMLTPECLSIDWKTEGIRAVIPVATFGMPQNAQAWSDWSLTHRIPVILDAAGAFGAQSSFGDIPVVISMHATKALSSGEGGLVFTENAALAQRLTQMTNFGIGPQSKLGGTNAKLSEFHAAVGHADLDVWSVKAQQRMDLYSKYKKILLLSCESRMGFQMDTGLTSPTMMVVQFKSPDQRDEAEQACQALGIQTRRWYQPLIQEHPALSGVLEAFPTPQARDLSKLLLGLPFFLGMSEIDLREIASTLSG